jgi:hypothetical protein
MTDGMALCLAFPMAGVPYWNRFWTGVGQTASSLPKGERGSARAFDWIKGASNEF